MKKLLLALAFAFALCWAGTARVYAQSTYPPVYAQSTYPPMPNSLFACFAKVQFTLIGRAYYPMNWPPACFAALGYTDIILDLTWIRVWQQSFPTSYPGRADAGLVSIWNLGMSPDYSTDPSDYTYVYIAPTPTPPAPTPVPSPTSTPTSAPTPTPTSTPTSARTSTPTSAPTSTPTSAPTPTPIAGA